jgi:hypothetical protein
MTLAMTSRMHSRGEIILLVDPQEKVGPREMEFSLKRQKRERGSKMED